MAFLLKENCARTTINQAGGIDASEISLIVSDASDFPSVGDFLITIWNKSSFPDPCDDSNAEIARVTNVVGNTFTITRGQEDSAGSTHANGQAVEMLITAGTFENIEDAITTGINLPVIGEDLSSQANGSNTTFTFSNDYISTTTSVYLNGIRLQRGVGKDYTEDTSDTIEISPAPISGEQIVVDYYIS